MGIRRAHRLASGREGVRAAATAGARDSRVIREVPPPPAAAPTPPPPNRPPTFNGPIQANPPVLEPGQSTNLSAPATDPDGDTITYTWSAPAGSFSSQNGMNTIWTAPNQEGNYPLTVTANDGRGGTATNSITIPVMRRAPLVFDDVHFDFDMSNLKPEAIRILDDAVMKLQANPTSERDDRRAHRQRRHGGIQPVARRASRQHGA